MKFAERIGAVRKEKVRLSISKRQFLSFMSNNVCTDEELLSLNTPNFYYFGILGETGFRISENQTIFTKRSGAELRGVIKSDPSAIEIELESRVFAIREIVFLVSGLILCLTGLTRILLVSPTSYDGWGFIFVGMFFLAFTISYVNRDSKLAILNFKTQVSELDINN